MNLNITFNLDNDGFLSQECPTCLKRFKAKFGSGSKETLSYCPYCGHHGSNCWWTQEQVKYIEDFSMAQVLVPELKKFGRDMERTLNRPGSAVSFKANHHLHAATPTAPPENPDNWPMHTFVCCGETIKHAPKPDRLHCVICGKR